MIVPFLNAGPFLADAIASVRAQTVPDWELILVDDGSTDASAMVAAASAAEDQRIRLLGPPSDGRRGTAAARNRGFEASRGDFIAFLDADDCLEPVMLETTLSCTRLYPDAAAVIGLTHWWHPGAATADWTEPPFGRTDRVHPPPQLLVKVLLLQGGQVPCVGSVLIRRQVVEVTVKFRGAAGPRPGPGPLGEAVPSFPSRIDSGLPIALPAASCFDLEHGRRSRVYTLEAGRTPRASTSLTGSRLRLLGQASAAR